MPPAYYYGFIELGMYDNASDEFEAIEGEDRMSMAVMSFRIKMHRQAEQTTSSAPIIP